MRYFLVLLLLTIAAPVFGQAQSQPLDPPNAPRFSGIDASSWQITQSGSATTNVLRLGGTGAPACVPWGMIVYQRSDALTCWCWSMDPNVTIAAPGANGACDVTDTGGPDGRGSCWTTAAAEPHWEFPAYAIVPRRPGARGFAGTIGGVCSVATSTTVGFGERLRPPCGATADCTAVVGSGTCEATSVALPRPDGTAGDATSRDLHQKLGCAYLVWRPSGAAVISVGGKR